MNTSPTLPVSQSQEQITFDVSPPFFKDGCSLNPSTYNPSADQVNYWQENSGNIMELYGNGFPTTCNPSPLEDIYYSLSGFITLINGNSVLIKPGGFLHQVTGDSSVTWNLDMKFESSSGTVYTFTNLKGIVGTNGLMNITSGTTSNGYGEFKQPTNEGTVQFTNLEDDAGNVFTTYDDAIKLANYDPTTGTSTDYVICSYPPLATNSTKTISSGTYNDLSLSNLIIKGDVTLTGQTTINGTLTIEEGGTLTNSGILSCGGDIKPGDIIPINSQSTNPVSIPAAISVYGKLRNDNKSSVIYASPNIVLLNPSPSNNYSNNFLFGNGIEFKKGGSKGGSCTNNGYINNGITNGPSGSSGSSNPLGPLIPKDFPFFFTLETGSSLSNNDTGIINGDFYLETGSSLTNSGTICGNIGQETGSSLTNNGTIKKPSNNQS